ncbi:MAG: hypothetical protein PHF67_04330, partial [Candidatus Nanoarchaeia archaeon]|nr:hypothetical protein [Candidatus Nanoarchaeia archaeon]
MKFKIFILITSISFIILFTSNILAYPGILYFADENISIGSNLPLTINFSNGDTMNIQTDSKGEYMVDENNIFCWKNCNLVPVIEGESMTIKDNEIKRIEYTTSNYINNFDDYNEKIFVVPSFPKYDYQENEAPSSTTASTPDSTYYYIEFKGILNLYSIPDASFLSLNAYWIQVSIGNYSANFTSEDMVNREFLFNLSDIYSNQNIDVKYIFISDGNTPNLKIYNLKSNESSIIPNEN